MVLLMASYPLKTCHNVSVVLPHNLYSDVSDVLPILTEKLFPSSPSSPSPSPPPSSSSSSSSSLTSSFSSSSSSSSSTSSYLLLNIIIITFLME